MSSELTAEEKIGILNQHLKNLNQNKYNLFLTTLELGAVDSSSQLELQVIEDEIDCINSKINVLEQEKISQVDLEAVISQESTAIAKREKLYRVNRPPLELAGRHVILVDDGMTTGSSMQVAITSVRAARAARVTVAVPVVTDKAVSAIRLLVDELIYLLLPDKLLSVDQWYTEFDQIDDAGIMDLMSRAEHLSIKDKALSRLFSDFQGEQSGV
jgi:predicted phosphoribosyltransferase